MSIERRIGQALFGLSARGIYKTPPLSMKEAPLVYVSLLRHSDLAGYLVAIKSIYTRIGEGTVLVLDDGTLTEADRDMLRRHLPLIAFRRMDSVETGRCPRGKCWERLCAILEEAQSRYAIQVDADLVARGPLSEVVDCYRHNRSFALSNDDVPGKVTLAEMSAWMRERHPEWLGPGGSYDGAHIQVAAEAAFRDLPDAAERLYFRASAAFAGFRCGFAGRERLEEFSDGMRELLGSRWDEWGSEQVASNYVIANDPGSVELPSPAYRNHQPDHRLDDSVLLHFFGTYRYVDGRYGKIARAVIEDLRHRAATASGPFL